MPYIFRRYRLSKKRIHTADDANAGNMKTIVSSKTAFPIQKEGSGDMIYCVPCRRKNGTAAPEGKVPKDISHDVEPIASFTNCLPSKPLISPTDM